MNYEDRTDLLPPTEVVSASVLDKLRAIRAPSTMLDGATDDDGQTRVTSAAEAAITARVREDVAPERGAPPHAFAVEIDAMLCGYRFGRLAIGPLVGDIDVDVIELRDRADSMFLYDLFLWDEVEVLVHRIMERNGVTDEPAFEEAVVWAWAFGLGIAAVETDMANRGR